jgi:hypothetical protein
LCGIILSAGRKTASQQGFLSFKRVARFDQLTFGSNEVRLRSALTSFCGSSFAKICPGST